MLLWVVNSLPSLSLKDSQLERLYQTPVFPQASWSADEMREDPTEAVKSQREKLGICFSERVRRHKHSCGNDALSISTSIWCSQEDDSAKNKTLEDSNVVRRPILKVLFAKTRISKIFTLHWLRPSGHGAGIRSLFLSLRMKPLLGRHSKDVGLSETFIWEHWLCSKDSMGTCAALRDFQNRECSLWDVKLSKQHFSSN